MTNEGALWVELRVSAGRVVEVEVNSSRRTDVAAVLRGGSVAQALAVVPSLFSICGTAHAVAAVEACEAALGVPESPAHRDARRLLCALEALDNHAFWFCIEGPKLWGESAAVVPLRALRAATLALAGWVYPTRAWARPGGVEVDSRPEPTDLLARLEAAVSQLVPAQLLDDGGAWRAWTAQAGSPTAALLGALEASGAADFGRTTTPLLPSLPVGWFSEALTDAGFSSRPTLDGRPAESGALALCAELPAIKRLVEQQGRTVSTRLLAKLADFRRRWEEARDLAQALRGPARPAEPTRHSGRGAGLADTARGRLAHAVEVEEGQVVGWRSVAPTEWTFHPNGVVPAALLGAAASDLHRRAEWLVGALDPCVPCSVDLQGA